MIHEADLWTDDQTEAEAANGKPLAGTDLVCVAVVPEQEHDSAPAPLPPIPDPTNPLRAIPQPPPPMIEGRKRWRLHYELAKKP